MKKLLSTLAVATALTTGAQAGAIVDLSIGGGVMSATPAGKIGDSSATAFDLAGNLGLDSSSQSYMYFEFDHFIPVIPNFRYEKATLDFTGTATQTVTFGTLSFTANSPSNLSMTNEDYIFYWGVPFSTWLPMIDVFDIGLGVKAGEFAVGIDAVGSDGFPFFIPYGYARLHVTPPALMGIGFEFETKYISYSVASFTENIYKVDWSIEAPIPAIDLEVGVELGYKTTNLNVDAGADGYMNLDFNGLIFGAFAHFGI